MSTKLYQCSVCHSTYSSSSHLRRHEAIHRGQRAFSCHFCDRKFFRADVARRHSRSCALRGENPLPDAKPRGKKRKACIPCARAKRGCNLCQPCEACQSSSSECIYAAPENENENQNVDDRISYSPHTDQDLTVCSDQYQHSNLENEELPRPRIAIQFLLNFTRPERSYRSLPDFFRPSKPNEDSTDNKREVDAPASAYLPSCYADRDMVRLLASPELDDYAWDEFIAPSTFERPQSFQVRLNNRLLSLIDELKSTSLRLLMPEPGLEVDFSTTLFTVEGLLEARRLYFENWNILCCIVHEPTFDLLTVSFPLLLAVLLVGSTYSSNQSDDFILHDLGETYIFEHENFVEIIQGSSQHQEISRKSIEALQAAYLLTILQSYKNDRTRSRRMRTMRYNQVILATRMLGLTQVKNDFAFRRDGNLGSFDWESYIVAESAVRIAFAVFSTDTQFTMYYRSPPRFMLSEISSDLPSCEEAFNASESKACEEWLIKSKENPGRLSISACMKILMHQDFDSDQIKLLESFDWFFMFLVITVLFSIIFNIKSAGLESYNREPVERGLSNWRKLWKKNSNRFERTDPLGISKYVPEYWQITVLFWNNDLDSPSEQLSADRDSMDELHDMLQKFEAVSISNASPSN